MYIYAIKKKNQQRASTKGSMYSWNFAINWAYALAWCHVWACDIGKYTYTHTHKYIQLLGHTQLSVAFIKIYRTPLQNIATT